MERNASSTLDTILNFVQNIFTVKYVAFFWKFYAKQHLKLMQA